MEVCSAPLPFLKMGEYVRTDEGGKVKKGGRSKTEDWVGGGGGGGMESETR